MNKIAITIAVTIFFLITTTGVLYFVNKTHQKNIIHEINKEVIDKTNPKACKVDKDCVSATCCHPTQVVNKHFARNCSAIMCTMSCETILDCGRGVPVCNDGICEIKKHLQN